MNYGGYNPNLPSHGEDMRIQPATRSPIDAMEEAIHVIEGLRRDNMILSAKVSTLEMVDRLVNLQHMKGAPPGFMDTAMAGRDVVYALREEIDRARARQAMEQQAAKQEAHTGVASSYARP